MVEFALVLPILVTLLFAIIQFGIVFKDYLVLTDAVRAGARAAAVSRTDTNPGAAAEAALRKAAVNLDAASLAVTVSAAGGWKRGEDVRVAASYPYSIDVFGVAFRSGRLASETTERIE